MILCYVNIHVLGQAMHGHGKGHQVRDESHGQVALYVPPTLSYHARSYTLCTCRLPLAAMPLVTVPLVTRVVRAARLPCNTEGVVSKGLDYSNSTNVPHVPPTVCTSPAPP